MAFNRGDLLISKYPTIHRMRSGSWGTERVDMALVIGCSARDPEYVDALLGERIVIIKIDDYVKVVPR